MIAGAGAGCPPLPEADVHGVSRQGGEHQMGTTSHLGREHRRRPAAGRAYHRPPAVTIPRAARVMPDTAVPQVAGAGGKGRAGVAGVVV